MKYIIKRGNTQIAEVQAEGQVTERIMGEQLVDATFSLPTKVQFQLWDSIVVDGRTYYLHATPTEEKLSKRNFHYTLQFAGVKYFLANILCLFPDKDNALTLSEFSITGTATKMLDLIVQNANREQSGWSVGTVSTSETKQVDFSGHSCLSALAKVAEAFDLEYWVDANKTVSLEERKQASGYTFEYGIHKGLKGITRLPVEGANIVTRVYAEGSEKNLPADYRNYKKRLQMPVPYLERNTAKYGVIEAVQRFDDIYPHRTGTVTSVDASNPLIFTDANMPFDLNATDDKGNTTILINKVSAKVTFNTGQLAGYTFEIKEGGYDHSKKTFELLVNKDEKDLEVPSKALRPAVGDTYVITDIMMPQSYITTAEVELQAKAQEYLDKNSEQRNVYEVVADPIYFAEQNVNIVVGHTCLFNDVDFGLNAHLRVLGTVKNLQNLKEVQFELGETATIIHIVRAYFKAEKNTTSLRQYLKYNAEMAKRSYSFAREIVDNVFDNEGYFDAKKIKPLSIDTKLLTVGSRSQQFNLVDVLLTVEQNNTAVSNTAGQIIHLTIEDRPRTWNIPANTQGGIGAGFHYVYVKAQRVGTNANILVSNERIKLEQDAIYYHFEVGYLGSVQNGFRRIKTNYGFTQVSPGEITTGRISSANGQQYIDLLQDRININANVTFTSSSPALAQTKAITETAKQQAISTSALDATSKADIAKVQAEAKAKELIDAIEVGGRNLLSKNTRGGRNTTPISGGVKILKTAQNKDTYFGLYLHKTLANYIGKKLTLSFDCTGISATNNITFGWMNKGGDYLIKLKNGRNKLTFTLKEWTGWMNDKTILVDDRVNELDGFTDILLTDFKLEKGTKATAHTLAPEDIAKERDEKIAQAKTESKTAWETYANLKSSNAQKTAIDTAKAYALAKDNEKEVLIKSYADGKITTAEQNAINVATAKAELAETNAKTWADGKVTAEEQRAIADAKQKLAQAEAKAKELVDNIEVGGRNLLSDFVRERSFLRFYVIPVKSILENYIEKEIIISFEMKCSVSRAIRVYAYQTNGISISHTKHFTVSEVNKYQRFTFITKAQQLSQNPNYSSGHLAFYDLAGNQNISIRKVFIGLGNKFGGYAKSEEDIAKERDEKIAEAKTESKTAWETYANLKSSNAQKSAIDTAKAYALAKDNEKETLIKAYADGKITTAEQNAINVATAKAELAETNAKTWADGKVTAEEKRAIADAKQKLAQAEAKAKELVDAVKVGGVNLFDNKGKEFSSVNEYVGVNISSVVKANLGKEMTISADVKVPIAGKVVFYSLGGGVYGVGFHKTINILANKWVRISATGVFWKEGVIRQEVCNLSFYGTYGTGRKPRVRNIKIEEGNKATAFSPSFADVAKERDEKIAEAKAQAEQANKAYITAQNFVNKTIHDADLDGVRTQAEQKAIDEANAKLELAKKYAREKDTALKVLTDQYANLKKQEAISTSSTYTDGKIATLKKETDKTKVVADYLSSALQKSTEAYGGLILSSLIATRDAQGKVTSYMSGDNIKNKTAFKAGINHFGTAAETHNVALNHDGTAQIGIFVVDGEGNIRVIDSTGIERIGFYKNAIDKLEDILTASTFALSDTGTNLHIMSATTQNVANLSLAVPKPSGILTATGKITVNVSYFNNPVEPNSENTITYPPSYFSVSISLLKNNVKIRTLFSEGGIVGEGFNFSETFMLNENTIVEQGTYTLQVAVQTGSNAIPSIDFENPKFTWKLDAKGFKKTVFGENGFLSAFPNNLLYFSDEKGLVVRGKQDTPGVLATGSVTQYGSLSNLWGAKVLDRANRISQGRFRVHHKIGHSQYTISVMCHSVGVVATVGVKSDNYFEFYMQRNGAYYNSGFDYVIYGRNYQI